MTAGGEGEGAGAGEGLGEGEALTRNGTRSPGSTVSWVVEPAGWKGDRVVYWVRAWWWQAGGAG